MAKAKEKKKKHYLRGIIIRLLFFAATIAAILAVGHFYFGWRPLGPKIGADQVGKTHDAPVAPATPIVSDLGSVIKDAIEENVPGSEVSPSPTAAPAPETITQDDQDALSNFLKKEIQ